MATTSDIKTEIKCWLEPVLEKDGVKNICVNVLGNSEKGDGYMGDIVFVQASGINEVGSTKQYNLVLKCSKRSQILRDTAPVKEIFTNEIYFYEHVLPLFTQFQLDKGIKDPFDSVPKCYGSFTSDNMEVIVLENLKECGYSLWEKKKPVTRKHLEMVLKEYGKFHAISVAINDQQPEKLQKIIEVTNVISKSFENSDVTETLFAKTIDDIYELLKDDLDENMMLKWKNFKQELNYIFTKMRQSVDGLKAILHGDCWNNNFMYQCSNDGVPMKVAIIDWQMSSFSSPIFDLSYFIFTCISKEDLDDLNAVLKVYYESFTDNLRKLGSDPDTLYSFNQLLEDWKKYCKAGIVMASLILKICSTEKDEVIDIAQGAEQGQDIGEAFSYEVKDTTILKSRMSYIIRYIVDHELI